MADILGRNPCHNLISGHAVSLPRVLFGQLQSFAAHYSAVSIEAKATEILKSLNLDLLGLAVDSVMVNNSIPMPNSKK